MYIADGDSIADAVKKTSKEIIGSYACAFIHLDWPNYITIFKGSVYPSVHIYTYDVEKIVVFSSTNFIINSAIKDLDLLSEKAVKGKFELDASSGVRINVCTGKMFKFEIKPNEPRGNSKFRGNGYGGCSLCEDENCEECPYFVH